jgi:hypothetical protein
MMESPYLENVNPQAIKMCEEAGWSWDPYLIAFVETRNANKEMSGQYKIRNKRMVSYEKLRRKGLGVDTTNQNVIESGLKWLENELSSPKSA